MDARPTYAPSAQTQCLLTNWLFGYVTGVIAQVKHFVFDDSVFPADEPRLDLAFLARLLVVVPILLLLCCLLWVLIIFTFVEWFTRDCVSAVTLIPRSIVRGFLVIGRLCFNCFRFVIGRTSTTESIEDHTLWDRWLDVPGLLDNRTSSGIENTVVTGHDGPFLPSAVPLSDNEKVCSSSDSSTSSESFRRSNCYMKYVGRRKST
jgi:hypothetical protein